MIDKKAWIKRAREVDTSDEKEFTQFFKDFVEAMTKGSFDAESQEERDECEMVLQNFTKAFEDRVKKTFSALRAEHGIFE